MRTSAMLAAVLCCSAADYTAPAGDRPASAKPEAAILPGGRLVTPLGEHWTTGSGTFGLAIGPEGQVATADGGPNGFSITLLKDGRTAKLWQRRKNEKAGEDDWRSVFMGLAFGPSGELYASEGNSGRVRIVSGSAVHSVSLNRGEFKDSYSGDLALDPRRALLYVVDQANFRVAVVDVKTRAVIASVRVGRLPFALDLSPDGTRVYVSGVGMFEYKPLPGKGLPFPPFGFPSKEARAALGDPNVAESNSLSVVDVRDARQPAVVGFVRTGRPFGGKIHGGSSPSGVLASADAVYVSNTHNDSISVVDPRTLKIVREIAIRIPGLEAYRGVMPIGLARDAAGRLLVAEAGINAVGVIDADAGKVLGHIPTAWFPTRVAVRGEEIYVANAKGFGTGPNKGLAESFQAELRRGAITRFRLPADLMESTRRVFANNGFLPGPAPLAIPDALRYVVVIVKENRTYDEIFGPGARFGARVTPNHHEIARRYASGSNFYADSEVSVDGHHWLVGSYPNAWTESTLMAAYGGEKDFRPGTSAPGRLLFAGSNSSVHPEEQPENGTLWHHLERHGISFRNFGEGFELAGVEEGPGLKPTGAMETVNIPMPDPLFRNTSRRYPQYNMNIPDQYRADRLLEELKPMRELPRLIYIHLPNDHIAKPRPKDGYPLPESFVADNDYALGRILEFLTRRPEWKRMAVFITEDDAQGGVDPVDSHRTICLVASPYAKSGYVSQRHSSFPGLLKTVFRILRIPPLNLYDAVAADLADYFTATADFRPYDLKPVDPAIFIPAKAREPNDPEPSPRMDDPGVLREQHRR
jgi:YVTN family beta-propeller protein